MKGSIFRFKGYTDDWVQRKLGDCCREFKSGSFITASAIEESGEYPVFGGNGLRGYTSEYNHDGEFALIGRQGALCGNMNYSTGKAYFTEHAVAVQTNDSADTKFMYYLLGKMKLGQYSDQSAQPGLAVGKLVTMNELFPTVEEQKKIGEMLTSLDNLITLHQRKCEAFAKLKKGMLQKMFPKNGKKVPEFRFKGFTGDWEQRKLGDVLSLENGYAFQSEFFTDEKTGRIVTTPGNVSVDGGFIRSGGKNYSAQGPCPNKFIFQSGDIFVTMTDLTPSANTLGKPAIVPSDGCTYLHNQRLGKLTNLDCDRDFLFSLLCTDMYHAEIVKTASGTTVKHSSPNRILNYEAYFPKFEEQVIIGHYFDKLDNLITLHQRKCDELKNMKKGLLQKMFI